MRSAHYVYAIVRPGTPLPHIGAGGIGPGLDMVRWRELAAVTERIEDAGAPVTMEAVLHHETVVEAVRQHGPALPVRFGTVFPDATSVASALAERCELLASDLDRLGDKVELSLTALWPTDPVSEEQATPAGEGTTAPNAGVRYLYARAAELRRAEAMKKRARSLAANLDQVLGGWALEQRVSFLPTPRIALRAAYLLDPVAVAAFRTVFDTMRCEQREVRLLLTGPWPPYSFVTRAETKDDSETDGRLAELTRVLTRCDTDAPRLNGRGALND